MTVGKAGLLTAGFVAAFALGVMTGPTIRDNWSRTNAPEAAVAAPSIEKARPHQSRRSGQRRAQGRRHRVLMKRSATKKPSNAIQRIEVSMWEPELRDRVKAVLNPGSQSRDRGC